jgi:hypothetical protein
LRASQFGWLFHFEYMDVYFDTNVYGHLHRLQHGVTAADVKKIQKVVSERRLRIFASFTVIEETNTGRLTDLDDVNGRLELIRTLTVPDPIIKLHVDILEGDILAYANGLPKPNKFERPLPGLKSIFWDHTAKNYRELDKAAVETKKMIEDFSDSMDTSFNKIRPIAQALKKQKKEQSFQDYWNEMAEPWAEQVTQRLGVLDKVKARGMKGLLKVHSFRIHTNAELSLTYANTYERTTFNKGNSRDMHHVGCASAVPIFVAHDRQLVNILNRRPIKGLEIIDIHTLLGRI